MAGGYVGPLSSKKYKKMAELHPAESYLPDGKGGVIYLLDGKFAEHFTAAEFAALLDEFGEEADEDGRQL